MGITEIMEHVKGVQSQHRAVPKSASRAVADDDIYLWDEHVASWSRVIEHSRRLLLDPDSGKS
jgi:hypothetical protein